MAMFRIKMEEESCEFHVGMEEDGRFSVKLGEYLDYKKSNDIYDGEYTVTPKMTPTTLPTNGKVMEDDVLVLSIPMYETTNHTGGTTLYIAMGE